LKVALLHDAAASSGRVDEQDALVQVAHVEEILSSLGHETVRMPLSLDMEAARENLGQTGPGLVFNLLESVDGHGRLIHLAPALLECMGIPFTGSPSTPVFVTTNKTLSKTIMHNAGLPTPGWMDARGTSSWTGESPGGRFIIKPVWEDASVGITDESVLAGAAPGELRRLLSAGSPNGERFAEAYIDGREFNLSILETAGKPVVLPPAEIVFEDYPASKPRIVGYRAKWEQGSFEYRNTVRRFDFPAGDRPLIARLEELTHACWHLFGLRGYARVDFRVDASGRPFIIEVNVNPCLSPDAGFAAAADRAGLSPRDVVLHIALAALSSFPLGDHVSNPPNI
jgi:D-alanine-D-alanine ligase